MTAQIIFLILAGLDLGIHIAKHGEPRNDKYNGLIKLANIAFTLGLLYWGGFFNVFFK